MIKGTNYITKSKKSIQNDLRKEFILASSDETFTKLCDRLKVDETILMKYTSKLETTVCELKNCTKCRNIEKCKNEIQGHVYYPNVRNEILEFYYKPCKYYKESLNKNTKNERTFGKYIKPNSKIDKPHKTIKITSLIIKGIA